VIFLTPKIITGEKNMTDDAPNVKYPRRSSRRAKVENARKKAGHV